MKTVKASVWSVLYRAFMVPPSNRTQMGVGVVSCKGQSGESALSGLDTATTLELK